MLEGLFDLAHDPTLQSQVLNNPAFGKILTAATRLPLISNDRRNVCSFLHCAFANFADERR